MSFNNDEGSYLDYSSQLAAVEAVDKEIFEGDEHCPEPVCDVMLLLGLVYNDLKYLQISFDLINQSIEESDEEKVLGESAGMEYCIYRQSISLMNEFQAVINAHKDILEGEFFKGVVYNLPAKVRNQWKEFFLSSTSAKPHGGSDPFAMIKNKTLGRYDLKDMRAGYQRRFAKSDDKPCVSYGPSMKNTRFYYADAAMEGSFFLQAEGSDLSGVFEKLMELSSSLTQTLGNISDEFIRVRKAYLKKKAK